MNKGVIYLSGGMEKAINNGTVWRKATSIALRDMGYEPLDIADVDEHYKAKHGPVYLNDAPDKQLQFKSNIRYQFVYSDLRLIKEDCDAVLAFYDQSMKDGAGSFAECQYAYDFQKPLIVVSAFDFKHVPGWLKALSTKLFFNFDDAYTYLAGLPDGILKIDTYGNHHSHNHYLCSLCGEVFEKSRHHFVSKVSPLYCKSCVTIVADTREAHADRYEFIVKHILEN